ncbi:phage tail tape measure protein [Marinobacter oulmenensis]|uniref:Putative nucleic acid-binding Zn-ribbon protein n=1 Tax=Marinobacter oulmenensis TaxID=643747 RepID=A0A840U5Q0_9GAMM|nr:hypothetical protein [Marinobacter oulmenensis]MBB5320459.1 putative nucleic acid-binding Zn-ribbon protein [Marinobacter oulmenensis]
MAKSLDLNVILAARDKITAPLKKINATSTGTARAIKRSQQEIKGLKSAQRDISAFRKMDGALRDNSRALAEAQERQRKLGNALRNTKNPTEQMRKQYQKARGDVEKFTRKGQDQRKELGHVRKSLKNAGIDSRNLGEAQAKLEKRMEAANGRIKRQQKYLAQLGKADVSGKFSNMTSAVGRFGRRAAFVTAGTAAGIFGIANSTAVLGDQVAKSSDALGIQIGKYQELSYAAKRSGINNFDSNIQAFTKRLGEAARGTGRAKDALESLGLSADALTQLSPDEALAEVAERMKDVDDPARRASLAADMFSRSGMNMVNMLKDGREGLKQYGIEAQATGNVLSTKTARDAEVFQDALLNAQMGIAGMKNTIGAELMPAISGLMGDASAWMRENRDQVKAWAKEFGTGLRDAIPVLKSIATGAAATARTLGRITSGLADLVGGFDNLGMILAFLIAMKPALAIAGFAKSIFTATSAVVGLAGGMPAVAAGIKAIGVALTSNPIGVTVMAIAGAAYLIYRNWDGIASFFLDRWKEVKQAFSGGLAGIGKLILNWSPVGLFYKAFKGVMNWFGVDLPDTFTGFGGQILDGLVSGLTGGLKKVKDTVVNAGKKTIGWFKDVLGIKSPSRVFMAAGNDTLEGYRRGLAQKEPDALKQVNSFGKRMRNAGAGIAMGAAAMPVAAGTVQVDSRPPVAAPATQAAPAGGDNITIHVHAAPEQNAQDIAAEVRRALAERDRQKARRAGSALYDRD